MTPCHGSLYNCAPDLGYVDEQWATDDREM